MDDATGRELRPTPVTAWAGGIPAFCMKRTFTAMPPTLAGVTRLTKLGRTACTGWLAGSRPGTPPAMPTAEAT